MPLIIGTEKAQGYAVRTIVIAAGAVAANTSIPLPAWAKGAQEIVTAIELNASDGTASAVATNLTIITTGVPAANEIILFDEDNVRVGNAQTTRHLLILALRYKSFRVAV